MKFLNKPWVKTVGIALAVIILWPYVRPTVQKIPVIGSYV